MTGRKSRRLRRKVNRLARAYALDDRREAKRAPIRPYSAMEWRSFLGGCL